MKDTVVSIAAETLLKQIKERNPQKAVLYLAIVAVAAAVLLLSGTAKKGNAEPKSEIIKAETEDHSSEVLEKKLEAILSSMRGAGKVEVMLTLDRTSEQVVASNEKSTNGDKSASKETRPATVQSGGREEAIVLTEVFPRIRGVIVIAEGAADIGVKLAIASAVSTVLGIDEKCVEVFVMASGANE
ncbi:MAG: hypothetical protein IKZ82_04685 [Clostridia bacterium]|nr:hypothetical protein [Clostridia bacterium]